MSSLINLMKNITPWGPLGFITFTRTYARKLIETDANSAIESFADAIERVILATDTQLKVGFTLDEKSKLRIFLLKLKGSVAGRFWWQLGTKTVDNLGLLSLQNCAFVTVDSLRAFTWAMDALMLGSGVGFNIQREYIYKLPKVKKAVTILRKDTNDSDFIVPDSRSGWIKLLELTLDAHFKTGKSFTYSTVLIRGKGALIKGFGGTASGPEELCVGIAEISRILNARAKKFLRPIDALDIMNVIGSIVVAGNVRRSAEIAIGDCDDLQFLSSKRWDLGNIPNYRAMSNNSVVCNDINILPPQFWEGYMGNGEPFGLINLALSRKIGRIGETQYPDSEIAGVNPCVLGETEILTRDGYQRIDELIDQTVEIWNGFEWSEVVPKVTGKDQEMVTVTFNDGRSLTCTKYHNFHIATNYHGKQEKIKAKDLEIGMKLIKHDFPIIEHGDELKDAYTQGFVSAEGMELNRTLYVYKPKEMCLSRIENLRYSPKWEPNNNRFRLTLDKTPVSKNLVPLEYNLRSKLEWLSGLFDGDGCELKEGGLQLASVNRQFLSDLQKLLSTLGVQSKVVPGNAAGKRLMPTHKNGEMALFDCQTCYRICVGAVQMQELKRLGLNCARLKFDKLPQRDASQFVTIVDITESAVADTVYCFTENKRNMGVFNGILTGQCAEQTLAPYETCCLAEIFLPNIESKEELLEVSKYLYRINKHSLSLDCHLEETEEIVHKNMRMGIGVTGYLQATEEQRSWLSETYLALREFDIEYSKKHNWPVSIKLTTVKPSGTLSLLADVTAGIHPAFAPYYIRRIRIASNSPLAGLCVKNGYHSEYQKNFDGTEDRNTVVVSFPCKVPEGTVIARDLTAIDQLEFVKRIQTEWSDNAVSCTVYYRKDELDSIKLWLKNNYNDNVKSVSFLLHSDHGFQQAPMQEITKEEYEEYSKLVTPITSGSIREDDLLDSYECVGNHCPVK